MIVNVIKHCTATYSHCAHQFQVVEDYVDLLQMFDIGDV